MTLLKVSDIAEAALNKWAEGLMSGEIPAWALPPSVAQFVHIGWASGCADRQHEIDQLERQVNRFHNLAFEKDPDRRARLEARLSQALGVATEAQWQRIEHDLAVMAGRRITTNIEGAATVPVGSRNDGRTSNTSGPSAAGRTAA